MALIERSKSRLHAQSVQAGKDALNVLFRRRFVSAAWLASASETDHVLFHDGIDSRLKDFQFVRGIFKVVDQRCGPYSPVL